MGNSEGRRPRVLDQESKAMLERGRSRTSTKLARQDEEMYRCARITATHFLNRGKRHAELVIELRSRPGTGLYEIGDSEQNTD